jgi:glycosyltransferase involved in cell wall biosynthesis
MRRPFQQGFPVLAVSNALLGDIRSFARQDDFKGFVVPNVVPLHGASADQKRRVPLLFAVNRWVAIKNPMPMLEGLQMAVEAGLEFQLIIGGYGPMMNNIINFVEEGCLSDRSKILGKMTKEEIRVQLLCSDGYIFNSNYETFSIACAEALGAGVPLIGPHTPAIAEYAGPEDWVEVSSRDGAGWYIAIHEFMESCSNDQWDRAAIAKRAADRFSETALRASYRSAMHEIGLAVAS